MSEFLKCFQQKFICWDIFLGVEKCSIVSHQVFYLQMSEVNMFEFILMATQSWAQRLRNRLGHETYLNLNLSPGNYSLWYFGQVTWFLWVSVSWFISGDYNTFLMGCSGEYIFKKCVCKKKLSRGLNICKRYCYYHSQWTSDVLILPTFFVDCLTSFKPR